MRAQYDQRFFDDLNCPNPVSWTNDIQKMFTALDIDHMIKAKQIHLDSYQSVKLYATQILNAVTPPGPGQLPDMPPQGWGEPPWTQDMLNTFACWIKQGCPQ
jgi:hypothetical protein